MLEIDSVTERMCVNEVKHGKPHISRNQDEYEQHSDCYQYLAPMVVYTQAMQEDAPAPGP